jgi:biopolymer transport protein ExbD
MAQANNGDETMISGINVTPLVDVVLVLLVVLMVTATYIASRTIPVDLPKGATGEATNVVLAITVDEAGEFFLDGARAQEPELRAKVREARGRDPEVRAVIAADASSRHGSVVKVIDLLRQERVNRFAINVEPQDVKQP